MSNSFDALLYAGGGLLRLLDLLTDIWYVLTQTFALKWMYFLAIATLFAPTTLFFIIFLYMGLIKMCQGHTREFVLHFVLALFAGPLESLGIVHCVLGCAIATQKSRNMGYFAAEGITRTAGFIVGVLNSLPQLVIQVYNNLETENWAVLNVVSLCLTAVGFVYTLLKCFWAVDNIQKLTTEHDNKTVVKTTSAQVAPGSMGEAEEAYESSESA